MKENFMMKIYKRLFLFMAAMLCAASINAQGDDAKYEKIVHKKKAFNIGVSGAVDLGLSVKWAACNVGATSPEEYGGYYAWGETEPKECYDWQSYFDCIDATGIGFKKYDSGLGVPKIVLDPEDDVARKRLGGNWSIPSREDVEELKAKCQWRWIKYNCCPGYAVVGPNGNAIFLPAAGYYNQYRVNQEGSMAIFWLNSIYSPSANCAYAMRVDGYYYAFGYDLFIGANVRAVCR